MSRSIHQTLRQVFYKKSKKEVDEMCDPNNPDIDVIEIWKKARIKNEVIEQRKEEKSWIKIMKNKIFNKHNSDILLYNNICGNKIIKVIFIHDYMQLVLENKGILNLNNKVTMPDDISLIENNTIKDYVLKNNKYFKLILNNKICIEMSLRPEDYNGPEAFEFTNGEIWIVE